MTVKITWHSHSTYTLDIDGTKLVIDPFLDDNPTAKVKAADLAADFVLLTHGHGDHVADALPIATRTGAQVIANFEIANWVNAQGHENTHPQHIGGGWNHAFGRLKFTPALHGSGLPDGSYGGNPAGFLLSAGGKNIYISGDTALFSDMSLIGEAGLDVAIVCIGDNFTMGPDDSIRAIQFLQPKVVIPCHYNTWPLIAVDVEAWARRVAAETDARPEVMAIEGTYSV
jgi:L-ascorbate metabolism protein UlaG (beta-lactamase superfamily)